MDEIWKAVNVPVYSDVYEVSTLGRVRRRDKNVLKSAIRAAGYLGVSLSNKGVCTTYSVHRIVALTFLDKPSDKNTVNHKNGNKQDNRMQNLEWCSEKDNVHHALETSLTKPSKRAVEQWDYKGEILLNTFPSIREAERVTGVGNRLISQVCRNQKPTAHGYRWKYTNGFEYILPESVDGVIIQTYPFYKVTRDGKIYSIKAKRFLVANQSGDYLYVKLCNKSENKDWLVHVLVAQAFLGSNYRQIKHVNGNKKDNRVENLELVE